MSDEKISLDGGEVVNLAWDLQQLTVRLLGLLGMVNGPGPLFAVDVMRELDSLGEDVTGVLASLRYSGEVQL